MRASRNSVYSMGWLAVERLFVEQGGMVDIFVVELVPYLLVDKSELMSGRRL